MPKITTNLKTETIKSIKIYADEHNKSEDTVIQDALDQYFEEDYEEYFDDLFEQAIQLKRIYGNINASFLQRELKIGYARADRISKKLNIKTIDNSLTKRVKVSK